MLVLCISGYDIASPGTTLHLQVRHCIFGYDIASPGTTLHLRVRHYNTAYDIASPGTTLQHWVRHCISGYDIASPGATLQRRVRHCISGYDIASPGTTLHLWIRHCMIRKTTLHNTGHDITKMHSYYFVHNTPPYFLYCIARSVSIGISNVVTSNFIGLQRSGRLV